MNTRKCFTCEQDLCTSRELALLRPNDEGPSRPYPDTARHQLGQGSLWIEDDLASIGHGHTLEGGGLNVQEDGGGDHGVGIGGWQGLKSMIFGIVWKIDWHHCFSIDNEIRSRFKIYSQLYVRNLWLLAKILCNSHRHCEYREVLFNRLKSKFNQSLHVQYVVYFVCYCHPLKCLLPHFYMIIRNSKYTQENQSIFSNTHLVFPCVWIAPPTESFLVVGTGGSNAEDDWERDQQEL